MGDLGARIWQARQDESLLPRADVAAMTTREDAYGEQAAAAVASGLTRAGWKVAATSELAQQMLGVPGPSIGPVFAEHIQGSPASAGAKTAHQDAVECEFAFVMSKDLAGDAFSRDDIRAAVDHAMVAIEIVGCRFEGGFADAGAHLCISDFSFNVGFVRGPKIENWSEVDLSKAPAAMHLNGEKVAAGTGADVMGDPVDALRWAAEEAARIGMPFKAGDVITTGTMTGAVKVAPGDHVIGDFGDLGKVEITFE
jgi:2-keto-4-pentenoate hydratase